MKYPMSEDEAVESVQQFNTTDALPYITKLIYANGEEEGQKYEGADPEYAADHALKNNRVLYHSVPGYLADVWRGGFLSSYYRKAKCPHCGGVL